jgi:V/A-type H+/Na+-transporting ATPase subunit C
VLKYAKGDSKSFLALLLERYDVERLKAALRLRHAGAGAGAPTGSTAVLDFPIQALMTAASFADAAALLKNTPYGEALASSAAEVEARGTLFPAELAIDRTLFGRIWEAGNALSARDRAIVRRLVGIEIDIKNLDWLSRFRGYYNLAFTEIEDLLLPFGSRLDAKTLRKMVSEDRVADAVVRAGRGTGVPTPESDGSAAKIDGLERFLSAALLAEAGRAFRGNPLSIGSMLGYFYCLRAETGNLRTLFAGKRLGLEAQQIEPFLVY